MEWIRPGTKIDFMGMSKVMTPLSAVLAVVSIIICFVKGFDLGIDFKGGTKLTVAFKKDVNIKRQEIRESIYNLVVDKTGEKGTQVEVQDFDVGGTGGDTVKYQIFTELPSLLSPLRKLEIAKEIEKKFGKGTLVETPHEAGDKFYITLPDQWHLSDAKQEIGNLFKALGYEHVSIKSDKEDRILSEMYREKVLLTSSSDEMLKTEAEKVELEAKKKIESLVDTRFIVEVEAILSLVTAQLKEKFGDGFVEVVSTASVSPSVGKELFETGMLALIYAIGLILIYIAVRFDMKFAPGAILCLIHDVAIVMAILSIFDVKFTLTIIAAILALIGYDINDTIVVYDRIRENIRKGVSGDLKKIINLSINETLSRTIMTSFVTELTVIAIWALGGGTIKDFALVMFFGIVFGTYSSIFVASPFTIYLDRIFRRWTATAKA